MPDTPNTLAPVLLTPTITKYKDFPAATVSRLHLCLLRQLGLMRGRAWVWIVPDTTTPSGYSIDLRPDAAGLGLGAHGTRDAELIWPGEWVYRGLPVNACPTPEHVAASYELWALCDYADYASADAAVLTTAEVISTAGSSTYTATTCIDTAQNHTASPANGDLVGRRVESGTAYLIVTSNAGGAGTSTITGSNGWRDKATGRIAPTPTAATAFTILASMRDTRELLLPANNYVGHLLETGAVGARRQVRLVGNNESIATYGTTFQVLLGGWPTALPTAGNDWTIDSLISLKADWTEHT